MRGPWLCGTEIFNYAILGSSGRLLNFIRNRRELSIASNLEIQRQVKSPAGHSGVARD